MTADNGSARQRRAVYYLYYLGVEPARRSLERLDPKFG
jgi:hypothetical protein